MPHLLDNSYVNLDILPGRKAEAEENMTDKAQETTSSSEGGNTAGCVYIIFTSSTFYTSFYSTSSIC